MKRKSNAIGPIKFAILAVDVLIFSYRDGQVVVRTVQVHRSPYFNNVPGLPGGLVFPYETTKEAALRITTEKAGISTTGVHIEQLYTFSRVDRDPRGRVVAVAYLMCMPWERLSVSERDDIAEKAWMPVQKVGRLAYDHNEILEVGLERIGSKVTYSTLASQLLPKEFTLTELETAMEVLSGSGLDKRNFRKKIAKLGIVKETGNVRVGLQARPAKLYKFAQRRVVQVNMI